MVDGTTADLPESGAGVAEVRRARPQAWGAWKGQSPHPETDEAENGDAPTEPSQITLSPRDLIALLLIVLGYIAGAIGLTAMFGWAGILVAFWITAVPTALVMGSGD
jgi:hypothetical protein